MTAEVSLAIEKDIAAMTSLDEFQKRALLSTFQNRIALIQGPPGTGKTFLGVKIVELIINNVFRKGLLQTGIVEKKPIGDCEEFEESIEEKTDKKCGPILLLTYKNHALDEFLLHALDKKLKVCRIGGRCEEPRLKKIQENPSSGQLPCLLHSSLKGDIISNENCLRNHFPLSCNRHFFQPSYLINELSCSMIRTLLGGCTWKNCVFQLRTERRKAVEDFLFKNNNTTDKKVMLESLPMEWLENAVFEFLPTAEVCMSKMEEYMSMFMVLPANTANQKEEKAGKNDGDDDDDEKEIEQEENRRMGMVGKEIKRNNVIFSSQFNANREHLCLKPDYKKVIKLVNIHDLLAVRSLWKLDSRKRVLLMHVCTYKHSYEEDQQECLWSKPLYDLQGALQSIKFYREKYAAKELFKQNMEIVGMTVTGAAVHHHLVQCINPSVVLVEEAAEVMEPQLMAVLQKSTKHLILIGDHEQLRPKVEDYILARDYKLEVSMMERLILAKQIKFSSLRMQNRMRPEIALLLHDIYPDLQSNLELVSHNQVPACLLNSVWFWSHFHPETKERSVTNSGEVNMILKLLLMLRAQDVSLQKVTVLAAYKAQTGLIKKRCLAQLHQSCMPKVHTVDLYQGDENDIVIVSLVRSNRQKKTGFLGIKNRRCVAQSRAKCAMVFIGNLDTLSSAKCWDHVVDKLKGQGLVGTDLPFCCSKHSDTVINIPSSDATPLHLKGFCFEPCVIEMPCRVHPCPKRCQPAHSHQRCVEIVKYTFPACLHTTEKACHIPLHEMMCQVKVDFQFPDCKHKTKKICQVPPEDLKCHVPINFLFSSCGHEGSKKCYQDSSKFNCKTSVCVILPRCGHDHNTECYKKTDEVKCMQPCRRTRLCRHPCHSKCFEDCNSTTSKCKYICLKMFNCDLHSCQKACHDCPPGSTHNKCMSLVHCQLPSCNHTMFKACHEDVYRLVCPRKDVAFNFPMCGHHGVKACSESMTDLICKTMVSVKLDCQHLTSQECYKAGDLPACEAVCDRYRLCGHKCLKGCKEICDEGVCEICDKEKRVIEKQKEESLRKIAWDEAEKEIIRLKKYTSPIFVVEELKQGDDKVSQEYNHVKDKVERYNYPKDNYKFIVKKIERITNSKLELKFQEYKAKSFGPTIVEKFHGTSADAAESIVRDGFRLPNKRNNKGLFGRGIYFATDSSKSIRYSLRNDKRDVEDKILLICDVIIGKDLVLHKPRKNMTGEEVRRGGYDSVYAPRGKFLKNDEYIIYDSAQALPRYRVVTNMEKIEESHSNSSSTLSGAQAMLNVSIVN